MYIIEFRCLSFNKQIMGVPYKISLIRKLNKLQNFCEIMGTMLNAANDTTISPFLLMFH